MSLTKNKWLNKKPVFKEECVFIAATKYNRNDENLDWDYRIWQIKKLDGEDENGESVWYWGLLNGDGEEWGDLADLTANKYFIVEPIKKISFNGINKIKNPNSK